MMRFVTSYSVQHQLSVSLFLFWFICAVEAIVIYITTKPLPDLVFKVTDLLCSGLSLHFQRKIPSPILLVC